VVVELVLKNYPPEFLIENESNYEFASKLVEQFMPYTERHYSRLNKLAQQCMFIDFTFQNMKLNNDNDENQIEIN
jgi:U3 small nucleolar RNA-associated protein 13